METKTRTKIRESVVAEVMYHADLKCCVCKGKGDHIHHLNGKKNDHRFENLVYLCYDHHNHAETTNLSRKLSRGTILKYREEHYRIVQKERDLVLKKLDYNVNTLTEEHLLRASKNALIIMELETLRDDFGNANEKKKVEILDKLYRYLNHNNPRLSLEILSFLERVSYTVRSGMSNEIAQAVASHVMNFTPMNYDNVNQQQLIELNRISAYIGYNIAYDAFIYLDNLCIAQWALSVIKYVYRSAMENAVEKVVSEIKSIYTLLESNLNRPERSDLEDAKELLKIFKADLQDSDLSFPVLPSNLQIRVDCDKSKPIEKARIKFKPE